MGRVGYFKHLALVDDNPVKENGLDISFTGLWSDKRKVLKVAYTTIQTPSIYRIAFRRPSPLLWWEQLIMSTPDSQSLGT